MAIEAHAVGTPVIGTRIGGLAELVTDGVNGRLVAPGDRRALAGVIREMIADPQGTIDRWRRALPRQDARRSDTRLPRSLRRMSPLIARAKQVAGPA